jgi:hypothetical protein
MERHRFGVTTEPTGATYAALIHAAARRCDKAYLIVRPTSALGPTAERWLASVEGSLLRKRSVASWPGTTLLGHEALMLEYRPDSAFVSAVLRASERLFQWQQPELPEDLGFMRANDDPWLVTIAHEGDAYLDLDDAEYREIVDLVPGLSLAPEE